MAQGIALNEDDSHFYFTRSPDDMTLKGVNAWLDTYINTQVDKLFLCPNAQRSSVASNARQPVWDGFNPDADNNQPFFSGIQCPPSVSREQMRRWVENACLLHQRGIDPYALWIARSRAHGIGPWTSMRMNDIHWVDQPEHPIHDRFWKEHPEYRRVPWRFQMWADRAFDYGRPEVRQYQMNYVRELIERYDMDGLELDWMRFGHHFRPGHEEQGAQLLTEFTAEVRQLLNERAKELGHPIGLCARVPSRPETARALGMDAVTWARKGLVDVLVVTPFLHIEQDMPIELWKELLEGTGVTLGAGLMASVQAYAGAERHAVSLEMTRGAASALLGRGADFIYLFNYMDSGPNIEEQQGFQQVLREVGSPETMKGRSRRHVVTSPDHWAPGEPQTSSLPHSCAPGQSGEFRIHIGPTPLSDQSGQVRLSVEEKDVARAEKLFVRVNGEPCAFSGGLSPRPPWKSTRYAYHIPRKVLHGGSNVVEVNNAADKDANIIWMEIAVSAANGVWPTSNVEVDPLFPD